MPWKKKLKDQDLDAKVPWLGKILLIALVIRILGLGSWERNQVRKGERIPDFFPEGVLNLARSAFQLKPESTGGGIQSIAKTIGTRTVRGQYRAQRPDGRWIEEYSNENLAVEIHFNHGDAAIFLSLR